MGKSTIFLGQPLLCQLLKFFDKDKILRLSRKMGGERYVKSFDGWHHLVVMPAVIMRFDSLREITASTLAEARKLNHLGITTMPRRSTLSDANARRPEAFFEAVYRDLLASNRHLLSADSRSGSMPPWFGSLLILDSTTIPLFSNLIFKGVGRNPKNGQKKGGIKVHKIIRAEEGVASDIKFTSAATHDSFMLAPGDFSRGDLLAMDRAYIDYEKLVPLRYFYGESANAIKIQIWVTLIANLLLTLMQRSLKRKWSFSGLATMTRILLMCYVDYRMFFENPERDWQQIEASAPESPPELELKFE